MPATVLITRDDRNVPESAGRWKRGQIVYINEVPFTQGGEADTSLFVQFTITDKDKPEVDAKLMAPYNMDIDMNVIAGPDPSTGFRRINVRNNHTNSTGTKGGWTTEMADNIIQEWNARYPSCNLTTVQILTGTNPNDTWQCEGTFTTGQAVEFNQVVVQRGSETLDYRRLWFVNETGMNNIIANGGIQQGTASQFNNWLEDYRVTT
jgi:hypothetical protein